MEAKVYGPADAGCDAVNQTPWPRRSRVPFPARSLFLPCKVPCSNARFYVSEDAISRVPPRSPGVLAPIREARDAKYPANFPVHGNSHPETGCKDPPHTATQTDLVSLGLCESRKARHVARFSFLGRTAEVALLTRFGHFGAASLRTFSRSPESLAAGGAADWRFLDCAPAAQTQAGSSPKSRRCSAQSVGGGSKSCHAVSLTCWRPSRS